MYERPQHMTPDGLRRSAKKKAAQNRRLTKAELDTVKERLLQKKKKGLPITGQRTLSDEAAKLIAQAISGMLNH